MGGYNACITGQKSKSNPYLKHMIHLWKSRTVMVKHQHRFVPVVNTSKPLSFKDGAY